MVEEIVNGLFRLDIPMVAGGAGWTKPYLFRTTEGLMLIDTGFGTRAASEALTEQLADLGHRPDEVRRALVTHAHPDHLGMVSWLKHASPGVQVIMLRGERMPLPRSEQGASQQRHERWSRMHGLDYQDGPDADDDISASLKEQRARERELAPERGASDDEVLVLDLQLEDGDQVDFGGWALRAVATPGHTTGHLCLYEPRHRLMFTGDHVLSRITPNVSVFPDDEPINRSPLREYRESLRKVAAFDTARALPGHQDVIDDLPARCREILDHHEERLQEVHEAIGSARRSAAEIAASVTWSRPYEGFNRFKRRHALGEALAHLLVLAEEGRARRIETDAGIVWTRAGSPRIMRAST